jgi:hypothetical protein
MRGEHIFPIIALLFIASLASPFATIMAAVIKSSSMPLSAFLVLGAISLFFLGICIYFMSLCINHYRASRHKVLSISRGNPVFYYGDINAPVAYDKKDIRQVVQYGGNTRSNDRLSRTEIIFKDGSSINISGLLLSSDKMITKFPHQQCTFKTFGLRYFIPRAASTPS